jgi:hypothetical protein
MADDGELTADFPEAPPAGMVPYEVITLEIDGQPVTITVERERSDLATYGYPADRNVYVTTWDDSQDDLQIDDNPNRQLPHPPQVPTVMETVRPANA